ncbi:hypothetical protein ABZP36_031408 [Zizania latifolia]
MSDEVEMRQAKCRQDYKAVVRQCRELMEKLEAKNIVAAPQKRQKRSTSSETGTDRSSFEKTDRKELEETIKGFLKEVD